MNRKDGLGVNKPRNPVSDRKKKETACLKKRQNSRFQIVKVVTKV
jgi:hypothetical protein